MQFQYSYSLKAKQVGTGCKRLLQSPTRELSANSTIIFISKTVLTRRGFVKFVHYVHVMMFDYFISPSLSSVSSTSGSELYACDGV